MATYGRKARSMHGSKEEIAVGERTPATLDRRALIARAAAGAGAAGLVWAAPAVLRSDAAFGCTPGSPCTPTNRLDWSGVTTCSTPTSVPVAGTGVTVVVTTTGTATGDCFQVRKTASDACDPGTAVANFPRGIPTPGTASGPTFNQADDDIYSLYRSTATLTTSTSGGVTATFTFTNTAGGTVRAVNGVTFAIGDIDQLVFFGSNFYRDLITLTAVDDTGAVLDPVATAAAISVTKGSVAGDAPTGTNPFIGQANLISNSNATVVVSFVCAIRSFTVRFGSSVAGSTEQWVGISDILWCP